MNNRPDTNFNLSKLKEIAEIRYWAGNRFPYKKDYVTFESLTGYPDRATISAKDLFKIAEEISNTGLHVMIYNLHLEDGSFKRILWVDDRRFTCR
jgi:hypothetical protein